MSELFRSSECVKTYNCKRCNIVFQRVGPSSNRFKSMCKDCKKIHDKELRDIKLAERNETALQPMKLANETLLHENLLLTDNERVLFSELNEVRKKLKVSEASVLRLTSTLNIMKQPRKGVISECIVLTENRNKRKTDEDEDVLRRENTRLVIKVQQEELLTFYRSSFYAKTSLYKHLSLKGPDDGLF